ncbi:lysM and putative peptidoglycan-binding domain-containing protein 3 [Venturia canescens]|uniref:lysM and putative peptidoglycan-binding domain-containing protein 3 n=1 Tax=Venturia canescens TaxID=32260 RepID=UPI001C9D4666|nr:lysM and putative peptidoglycan-binding domain-containing protein 3 [Venturia canescens]
MRKKSAGSLNDQTKTSRQTVYQRGTQREGSPHYVFLYSDDENDGEEDIPLEPRNRGKTVPRKVEVIKVSLKPDDTLQALAVRYRCTISELKRINNIHKENEIFAHRFIKVPVQPFSIFTENLIDYEQPSTSKENGISVGQFGEASTLREDHLKNLIATPITGSIYQNRGINDIILNSICEPLVKSTDCESNFIAQNTESEQLLSSEDRELSSNLQTSTIDTFKCSGADWGLSWTHLLGFSLLLVFAGPLIYIFYIAEESPHENSN